jgi:hypothetical protein
VAGKTQRWLSVGGIASPLKNGYEEPSGSSQAAVHECYLNTRINGSVEPKLPRRWQ